MKNDISDNYYADVDGDNLPDLAISRIPYGSYGLLSYFIDRIIDYETTPPANTSYYQNPVTSMCWVDNSFKMFNAEIVNGFFTNQMNKDAIRENAIFNGTPNNLWYVTPELLEYFGPDGLGYVPATPEYLTDWDGNADRINNDLNNGALRFSILISDNIDMDSSTVALERQPCDERLSILPGDGRSVPANGQ